jgi:DNA-binding NtrC family response regulator
MCTVQFPCLVLFVDDDKTIRDVFSLAKDLFLSNGLDLVIKDGIVPAEEFLESNKIDVGLVDMNLPPDSEGLETLQRIQAKTRAPIIMFTGAGKELKALMLKSGAEEFVMKGEVDLHELIAMLKRVAGSYRERRRLRQKGEDIISELKAGNNG